MSSPESIFCVSWFFWFATIFPDKYYSPESVKRTNYLGLIFICIFLAFSENRRQLFDKFFSMNSENVRLLKAVFFTVVACLVVFAIAVSMFGRNNLWMPEKELPATIPLPIIEDIPTTTPDTNDMTGVSQSISPISTGAELCLQEYQPVCGIDKKTYANSCIADTQGISIAYD